MAMLLTQEKSKLFLASSIVSHNVLAEDVFAVDFKSFFTLICLSPASSSYLMRVTLMDIKYTLSMTLMIIDECFYDYLAAGQINNLAL